MAFQVVKRALLLSAIAMPSILRFHIEIKRTKTMLLLLLLLIPSMP